MRRLTSLVVVAALVAAPRPRAPSRPCRRTSAPGAGATARGRGRILHRARRARRRPARPAPRAHDRHGGTTTAPRTTAAAPDYRLGPGDKLRIEVYKDPQLSQSLQIRPDGKITLPLVGDLRRAAGRPTELRDAIATSLKEYVTNPVVTVIVVETHGADRLRDGRGEPLRARSRCRAR